MSEKNENKTVKTEKQLIGIEPEIFDKVANYLLNKPLPFIETKPLIEGLDKAVPVTIVIEEKPTAQ